MKHCLFLNAFVTVTFIILLVDHQKQQFVYGQNPPCYFCNGDPQATISNPDYVLDLSELGLPIPSATCRQVQDGLIAGLATTEQCEEIQTDPDAIQAQIDCGCSSVSTVPPSAAGTSMPTTIVSPTTLATTFVPTNVGTTIFTTAPTTVATTLTTEKTTTFFPTLVPTLVITTLVSTQVPSPTVTDAATTVPPTPSPTDISPTSAVTDAATTISPTPAATALPTVATTTASPTSGTTTTATPFGPTGTESPTPPPVVTATDSPTTNYRTPPPTTPSPTVFSTAALTPPPTTPSPTSLITAGVTPSEETGEPTTVAPTSVVVIPTLDDVLSTSPDLSSLNILFKASTVVTPFPFTFLVPSNSAFELVDPSYLNKLLRPRWILHLNNLVNKHIASTEFYSETFYDGQIIEMQNVEEITVSVTVDDNGSTVIGFNTASIAPAGVVEVADIVVDSGILHQVNGVIFPNFIDTTTFVAISNYMRFSIFYGLINLVPGLESILLDGDYTVLSPLNNAFLALGQDTLAFLTFPENVDLLNNTLSYHILIEVVPSIQFVDKTYETLNGKTVTVDTCKGLDFNGVPVGELIDILACNGIIHSLDGVLLPDDIIVPVSTPTPTQIVVTEMPIAPSKRRPSSSQRPPAISPTTNNNRPITVRVQDYFLVFSILYGIPSPEPTAAEYEALRVGTDDFFATIVGSTYPNFISVQSTIDFTAYNDPNYPPSDLYDTNFEIYISFDYAEWKFDNKGTVVPTASELFSQMIDAVSQNYLDSVVRPIGGTLSTVEFFDLSTLG